MSSEKTSTISGQPWDMYPRVATAACSLARRLAQGLREPKFVMDQERTGQFEFETRFATRNPTTHILENGVSEGFYRQSLSMMDECPDWKAVIQSQEIRDYYYYVPTQRGAPLYVRTRVEFQSPQQHQQQPMSSRNAAGSTESLAPTIQHVVKHKIFQADFDICSSGSSSSSSSSSSGFDKSTQANAAMPHSIRGCLNWEEDIPAHVLPHTVAPSFVRIIHPSRFLYSSQKNAHERPIWSYDFCMSWHGPTAEAAEIAQKTSAPTYEIEAECMDTIAYMKMMNKDEAYAATSLLLKTCDFLDFHEPPLENYVLSETIARRR